MNVFLCTASNHIRMCVGHQYYDDPGPVTGLIPVVRLTSSVQSSSVAAALGSLAIHQQLTLSVLFLNPSTESSLIINPEKWAKNKIF